MHEYSIAQSIIETASEYANGAKVGKITLTVGEASGVSGESVRLYFGVIAENTPCAGAEIEIESVRAMLRCKACGALFERKPFSFQCGCGGEGEPTEIGREFYIKTIDVMASVYGKNQRLADEFNETLTRRRVFCVNVLGAPGAGKTTSLAHIIKALGSPAFVIEGDIESDIDAQKLRSLGIATLQINTGGACHLDAPVVADAFAGEKFSNGFLFIENIGNLVCPAEFMIGEHAKLLVCAATDGSDKPYKYPLAFEKADIILLNKCDLLDYVGFDWEFFMKGVRILNPGAPVLKVSGKTGDGIGEAVQWLRSKAGNVIGS